MAPNTRLTTRKVPRDSVIVVTTICAPAFFIWCHKSSVPIIRPTVHSSRLSVTSNQAEPKTESLNRFHACGPKIIPVISQPKMEGRFNLATSFPATKANAMAARTPWQSALLNPEIKKDETVYKCIIALIDGSV